LKVKVVFAFLILIILSYGIGYRIIGYRDIGNVKSGKTNTLENQMVALTVEDIEQYEIINEPTNVLDYNYTGDLSIDSIENNMTLSLYFSQCGVNNLFAIDKIKLVNDENDILIESCTDWIGPYIVKAIDQDSDIENKDFTGGWHGTNGYARIEATACSKAYTIFADGKEITSEESGQANNIRIVTKNHIKGYNTDNYILEETVTYTIHGSQVDVKVEILALEDIMILRYYGLQTQNNKFDKTIQYFYEDGSLMTKSLDNENDSGIDNKSKVMAFELSSNNHPFLLKAWINSEGTLSSFDYLSLDKPKAFTTQYHKSYFNLIDGIPLTLKSGKTTNWSGGYSFKVENTK